MKQLPLCVSLATAAFLTICFVQARGRGIGFVPPPTDWELHPAWWHVNVLADCGEYLVVMPSVWLYTYVVGGLGIVTGPFVRLTVWISVGALIGLESLFVFFVALGLNRLFRAKQMA